MLDVQWLYAFNTSWSLISQPRQQRTLDLGGCHWAFCKMDPNENDLSPVTPLSLPEHRNTRHVRGYLLRLPSMRQIPPLPNDILRIDATDIRF